LGSNYKTQKEALLEEIASYRANIKRHANGSLEQTKKKGKRLLVASGLLLGAYGILQIMLISSKSSTAKQKEASHPTEIQAGYAAAPKRKKKSYFKKAMSEFMTSFMLSLASQVLENLLNPNKKEGSTGKDQ